MAREDARMCAREVVSRDDRTEADSRQYTAARARSRRELMRDRLERGDE
jgi:hypothetical protein